MPTGEPDFDAASGCGTGNGAPRFNTHWALVRAAVSAVETPHGDRLCDHAGPAPRDELGGTASQFEHSNIGNHHKSPSAGFHRA